MKRPIVISAVLFSLGITCAGKAAAPFAWLYGAAFLGLLAACCCVNKKLLFGIALCSVFVLAGWAAAKNHCLLPRNHIAAIIPQGTGARCALRGFVVSEPDTGDKRPSFVFRVREIQLEAAAQKACGSILVYGPKGAMVRYGDELILRGRLRRPFSFGSAARAGGYRRYLYRQGICFVMRLGPGDVLIRRDIPARRTVQGLLLGVKQKAGEAASRRLSSLSAGMLEAMILGDKRNVPGFAYQAMVKTGTVHILVVSGFNVGIVSAVIFLFLKLLRFPRLLRVILSLPLLAGYCCMTGSATPVVRATVMSAVLTGAYILKREPDICNTVALAGLAILAVNPLQLYDTGFQLSFASVLSIVLLYPRMRAALKLASWKHAVLRLAVEGCLVSLSAWLGTAGIVAYYFKIVSPVTVVANLMIAPLATLLTLCGLSFLLVGLLLPGLASPFAAACEALVRVLLIVNGFLLGLPGACIRLSQ